MTTFSPEGLETKRIRIGRVEVEISSHQLGERFVARVNDIEAGTVIGRGRAGAREQAEQAAIESASLRLDLTEARERLRSSLDHLKG